MLLSWLKRRVDSRRQAEFWERRWAKRRTEPVGWLQQGARIQVRGAVTSGWISAGCSIVDMGCGNGNTSIWLAEQGFNVVGFDVAPTAINKALDSLNGAKNVRFCVADVSKKMPFAGPFDVILDLGMLHQLPPALLKSYQDTLLKLSRSGTRMILLMRRWHDVPEESNEAKRAFVKQVVGNHFEILSVEDADMASEEAVTSHPGVMMKLIRK